MKNQGCCREKPHPVNLSPTVTQGVEGHQEGRQEVATDRQEGHSGGEGREKGSWKAATGLQVLCLPSLKSKERAWSQQQRHQWFNEWKTLGLKPGPGETPHCAQWTAGRAEKSLLLGIRGGYQLKRESEFLHTELKNELQEHTNTQANRIY